MVVLALLGLIASTIGVAVWRNFQRGQIKTAQLQIRETGGQVAQFVVLKNKCPTSDDLVREHFARSSPIDPWGNPLVILCPGEHEHDPADVVSLGPDKKANTGDDIRSWEL
jgi:general secretion pathway protein G